MLKIRKTAAVAIVAATIFVPSGLPTANADPTLSPDQWDYISKNAERNCQVLSINPLDSKMITALILDATGRYYFSGREAFAAIQEGVREYCPDVYQIWQSPPTTSTQPPP